MDNLDNLKRLLDSGVITNDEYNSILKRVNIANDKYEETWGDIVDDFYEWCTQHYALITAKGYKTCLYKFITWLTRENDNEKALQHKFETYSFMDANNLLNNMQENGFSSQSISKTRYSIAVLGKYLETKNIKAPDISKIKISIKNEVNNTTFAFRHDEIIKVANAGELRNKVCIMLAYEGCLRRAELVNIKVNDFDFDKKQLFIYDKDNNIDRVCVLLDSTIELVRQYIEELYVNIAKWNESRSKKGRELREDLGYIFQSVKMVVPSYSLLHTLFKENAKAYYSELGMSGSELENKVSKFSFENIRNSRKVYLLSQGISINTVMQMCGDKNYMSTHRFVKLVPALYPESIKTT